MKQISLAMVKNVIIAIPFGLIHYFLKANTNINPLVLAFAVGGVWLLAFVLLEGKKIYCEFGALNKQDEVSER